MKYKVGDKIKIKTWKELTKEFLMIQGLSDKKQIQIDLDKNTKKVGNNYFSFTLNMEKEINRLKTGRILTISNVIYDSYYLIKEFKNNSIFIDEMIDCLEKDYNPIKNRWEILDL